MHSRPVRALLGILALTAVAAAPLAAQAAPATGDKGMKKTATGASGMFRGGMGHSAGGIISISGSGKDRKLDFSDTFVVDKVPETEVVLARGTDGKNGLSLGKLKYTTGAQSYKLPESADLSGYTMVLLWVKKSGSLVASATLPADMSHGAMMTNDTTMKKN
jgi:hypothetical protein